MIPKIIWQTHEKKYNDLPPFQKNIIGTWKNLNPSWEYRYVDAEQRHIDVKNYSEEIYKHYVLTDNLHQSDIWRFITLYNHGGFYADMDSICVQGIDESLLKSYNKQELVCSPVGYQHYGINCSNFGSIKNSKILKSLIESIATEYSNIKKEDVPLLGFAFPENAFFSSIMLENKDLICFNKKYFKHCKEFKTEFDENVYVTINGEKIKYSVLCKNNGWPIYYI